METQTNNKWFKIRLSKPYLDAKKEMENALQEWYDVKQELKIAKLKYKNAYKKYIDIRIKK
jgi:hypothetical protein